VVSEVVEEKQKLPGAFAYEFNRQAKCVIRVVDLRRNTILIEHCEDRLSTRGSLGSCRRARARWRQMQTHGSGSLGQVQRQTSDRKRRIPVRASKESGVDLDQSTSSRGVTSARSWL